MARTKRKVNPLTGDTAKVASQKETTYRTAAYARLSVEDSGKPGAETIESQKALLTEYIEQAPDLTFSALYYDNGETGTNFHRPGFEQLMEAVRRGEVNCIVVKDLSRFGRNYKETGNYLERIFPFLGVRFIAVTDGFDTLTAERGAYGYIVPLKNLINETYSRDISQKSAAALHTKQQRGEFIGAWAPYGYRKDPENPHHLVVNEETAPVVREIFQMRTEGFSAQRIARTLNDREILSPSAYLYNSGLVKNEKYRSNHWNPQTIKALLSHSVYCGHMVQGRKRQSFAHGQAQSYQPKEDWIIVEDTHEPIVDQATYDAVQKMAAEKRSDYQKQLGRFDNLGRSENLLRGLVFCADCGRPLVRYKSVSHGKKLWYVFICPSHSADPASCPKKSIREDELFSILQETIAKQMQTAVDMKILLERNSKATAPAQNALGERLERESKALSRREALRDGLYQSYVEGLMSEAEYLSMKERYGAEIQEKKRKIRELEKEIAEAKELSAENPCLTAVLPFENVSVKNRDLLTALVERIEIGAENRVSIHLKYRDELAQLETRLREEGEQ